MEIKVLNIESFEEGRISKLKEMVKKVTTNKCVVGGAVIGTVAEVYSKLGGVEGIGVSLNSIKELIDFTTGVSLAGITLGSFTMKALGYVSGGFLVASLIKTGFEIYNNPDKAIKILVKEGIMLIIFGVGMGAMGVACADAMKTISDIAVPNLVIPSIPFRVIY